MAAPVINPAQSIPGFLQYQTFSFQPAATNTPTSWTCTTLPSGLTFTSGTGKIAGSVAVPGVYDFILTASNADGASQPVGFCFAIEASGGSAGTDLDLEYDLGTRQVSLPGATPVAAIGSPEATGAASLVPLFRARLLDEMIASVRLTKNGVTVEPATVTALTFGATDESGDAVLVTSGTIHKSGTGDAARYRVPISFTTDAVKGDVGNSLVKATDGTLVKERLLALCDLKLVFTNPDSGTVGPASIRIGSDTFVVELSRNIAA